MLVEECISFTLGLNLFSASLPFLEITGIFPDMGTPGTENKIRKCCPLKQKLLAVSTQSTRGAHSEPGRVLVSVTRVASGAEEIKLLNSDLQTRPKPAGTPPAIFWSPTYNKQLPYLYFFLFQYLTFFSPIKVMCTFDRNFRKIFSC